MKVACLQTVYLENLRMSLNCWCRDCVEVQQLISACETMKGLPVQLLRPPDPQSVLGDRVRPGLQSNRNGLQPT